MPDPEHRIVEFERLNLLGKAVYVSGQVVRTVGGVLEFVVDAASDLLTDAERAFREGLGPDVDDANILDEHARDDAAREEDAREEDVPRS